MRQSVESQPDRSRPRSLAAAALDRLRQFSGMTTTLFTTRSFIWIHIAARLTARNCADISRVAIEALALEGYRSGELTYTVIAANKA